MVELSSNNNDSEDDPFDDLHPFVQDVVKRVGRQEMMEGEYDGREAMLEFGEQLQNALIATHSDEQLDLLAQATREDRSVEDIIREKQDSDMPVDETTQKVIDFRKAQEQMQAKLNEEENGGESTDVS